MTNDNRKNVKVAPAAKVKLEDLKKKLSLKNESEVIGYLLYMFDDKYSKLAVVEDKRYRDLSKEINNKLLLF